jgi:hypothetical protein
MTSADWPFYVSKAVSLLNPLLHLLGLVVCVWAYRFSRKSGYLIIAAYCLMALCTLMFGPAIKRMIRERSDPQQEISTSAEEEYRQKVAALTEKYYPGGHAQPELSAAAQQQYVEDMNALAKKYYPAGPPGITRTIRYDFPLGPIILVLGIWVLARQESKTSPNQTIQATAAAPRS